MGPGSNIKLVNRFVKNGNKQPSQIEYTSIYKFVYQFVTFVEIFTFYAF